MVAYGVGANVGAGDGGWVSPGKDGDGERGISVGVSEGAYMACRPEAMSREQKSHEYTIWTITIYAITI